MRCRISSSFLRLLSNRLLHGRICYLQASVNCCYLKSENSDLLLICLGVEGVSALCLLPWNYWLTQGRSCTKTILFVMPDCFIKDKLPCSQPCCPTFKNPLLPPNQHLKYHIAFPWIRIDRCVVKHSLIMAFHIQQCAFVPHRFSTNFMAVAHCSSCIPNVMCEKLKNEIACSGQYTQDKRIKLFFSSFFF